MQYDFDQVIDRSKNLSAKYDERGKKFGREDVIPLWIADMDFKTAQPIIDALKRRAEEGIWGYTARPAGYFEAIRDWQSRRNGWAPDTSLMSFCLGVVQTLSAMIQLYTPQGGNVLIQTPVYGEFYDMAEFAGRRVIENQLVERDDRWTVDWADLEEKLRQADLFLLCSPHNPVGIVWPEEDLRRMMELCRRHRVLVVSDEIHADFAFQGKHQVFANLKKEYASISVICTAPSKTFNLAGLVMSNIFIMDDELRRKFRAQMNGAGVSQLGVMGLVACEAAYGQGEEWYQAMMRYVKDNIDFIGQYVKENLPDVRMVEHEGTYLVWLDFRKTGLDEKALEHKIVHEAKLWLDGGAMFGEGGSGFQRVNAACPRKTLTEAMERIKAVL